MILERTDARDYGMLFPAPSHIYDSVAFSELNRRKCDDIHYIVMRDDRGKPRLGIILGERDGMLRSPFSAPFGGVEQTRAQRVEFYLDFVGLLREYACECGKDISLTLPPAIYDRGGNVNKLYCALLSGGVRLSATEYNYHYATCDFDRYVGMLSSEDRKKFRKAERAGFRFEVLGGSDADIARAYDVIRRNRESHGYALRMTLDDVIATAGVVNATFMVMSLDGEDVAAVQAYDVADGIAQIIYWGDVPGYQELRPMRYLPFKVFEYFSGRKAIVDVGPSSTDGVPSIGLCDFKEEVGCILTPKPSFIIEH